MSVEPCGAVMSWLLGMIIAAVGARSAFAPSAGSEKAAAGFLPPRQLLNSLARAGVPRRQALARV